MAPPCAKKVTYQTVEDARRAADEMRSRGANVHPSRLKRLKPFWCAIHVCWHLGHHWTAAQLRRRSRKTHQNS